MAHIPIVMKAWAGSEAHDFEYIRRSLPSLLASKLPPNARILIFDDCSTDPRLGIFLKEIAREIVLVLPTRFVERVDPGTKVRERELEGRCPPRT